VARQTLVPYIRQSKAKEKTISLDDQRRIIKTWARNAGVSLAPEVVEQGVSGSKPWRERDLGRVIAACEAGTVGGIVVAFQDRLSRENGLATAEVWEALDKAGARLVAAGEGLDTATGDQELLFTIKAGIAREQWKRHRKNWSLAVDSAISRGIYVGMTPVGFTKDEKTKTLRQNADAKAVRQVFLSRANGRSWNNLCADLEAAGVKTATGGDKWHLNSVRSLIGNPIYKGTLVNGHEHHFPAYAIVTASEWQAAQPTKGERNHDHAERGGWALLGGRVRCESCGRTLTPSVTTKPNGTKFRYYKCQWRGCTSHANANADKLEEWVSGAVLDALRFFSERGDVTTGSDLDIEVIAGLEQSVEDAKERRRQMGFVLDPNDPKDVEALERLSVEVEEAKAALTDALGSQSRRITPEEWEAGWPTWALDERRRVLTELNVRVVVSPGKKISEGGVALTLGDDTDTTSVTLGMEAA